MSTTPGSPRRRLSAALVLLAALFLGPLAPAPSSATAFAQDAGSVDWTVNDRTCRCQDGNGCWHYLRAPMEPPADACWCNFCEHVSQHDGTRSMPEGWSRTCASGNDRDCFLHRHAYSWGLVCTERWRAKKCCNLPNWENCPRCEQKDEEPWRKADHDRLDERLAKEQQAFASARVVIVWSPHFYVVTDIPSLKVRTKGGSFRVVGTHELAHIYAERAEKAYREFVQAFGPMVSLPKPAGIYLPAKERTAGKLQAMYNSSPRTNLTYGGSNDGKVADGFCFNGFVNSLQKSGDDVGMHHAVRHMIGHLLVSCWVKVDGKDRVLPRWMFEGVAHWLAKQHPMLEDEVVWCADEGTPISGSGKGWDKDARKIAASSKTDPIERLLGKSTIGLLEFDDHVRAWSYMKLGLEEDNERWVRILAAMRNEVPPRQAWMEIMGCTPEVWDERWKDRVLGRRPTLGEMIADLGDDDDGPGAAERAAIRRETDMANLTARVRSVGECTDPRLAAVLVQQFARDSDAVREALVVVLSKTKDPETLKAIRLTGFQSKNPFVRAYTARVLGFAGDQEATDDLVGLTEDDFWLARAEAALGLMRLQSSRIVEACRPLLSDSSAKVRIAAMDAVGTSGTSGERVLSLIIDNLSHSAWQVRSATADCLGGVGSMSSVDALIDRMTTEAGRIRKDCREALKNITHDDLGLNPENWTTWWKRERERNNGGIPNRPEPPPDTSSDEERYGFKHPPNYGLRVFSDRVGYVLDLSGSMFSLFEPDPAAMRRLRRTYKGANKFDISREEIVQSIESLDPRARFNIYAFADRTRTMSKTLLPATPGNHGKAASFLRSNRSSPGSGSAQLTNFYEAFRVVLDLPKRSTTPPPGFTDTPDTMFFLTDGAPTIGEIIDADELLAWFNGLNRYARIRVHVVAYGTMGIDLRFLRGLAENNEGEFIHIGEASRSADLPDTTPK